MMNISTRAKAILSITTLFLSGLLIGGLIVGLYVRSEITERRQLDDREGFASFFSDRLGLSELQRDSLQQELDRAYQSMQEVRALVGEEYALILDSLTADLGPSLTQQQRAELQLIRTRLLEGRQISQSREVERSQSATDQVGTSRTPSTTGPNHKDMSVVKRPVDSVLRNIPDLNNRSPRPDTATVAADEPAPGSLDAIITDGDQANGESGIDRLLQRLNERLNLSEEQKASIREILVDARGRARLIRKRTTDPDVLKRRLRMHRVRTFRQILSQLDEEQKQTFRSFR